MTENHNLYKFTLRKELDDTNNLRDAIQGLRPNDLKLFITCISNDRKGRDLKAWSEKSGLSLLETKVSMKKLFQKNIFVLAKSN